MESILTALSLHDILRRKVPVWLLPCLFVPVITQIVMAAIAGEEIGRSILIMLLGMIPGAALILVGVATRKVGMADGIVLCMIGMLEGIRGAFVILALGSFVLSLVSMVLLAFKKVRKETGLPFIPFLGLGLIVWRVVFV